jgi:MoxR-like ATPase
VNASAASPTVSDAGAARAREEGLDLARRVAADLRAGVAQRIVGLDDVVEQVLIGLFTRGHLLLEGVPGLAKTMLLSTTAQLLDLEFSRIQFTPDLMPGDITGSEYLVQDAATGQRSFRFAKGPLFANVVLADEINRAPPKTQAALMEAMEERQVTSIGVTRALSDPFFVLATQNPIEQQGTYPLPAAQLDRFLLKVELGYPSWHEEARIARLLALPFDAPLAPVATGPDLRAIQDAVARIEPPADLVRRAVRLAHESRPKHTSLPSIREWVEWGVGPRAAQALVVGAKARAVVRGRTVPTDEDLTALAPAVFRHRLILSYAAEADGVGPDQVVAALLDHVPGPAGPPRRRRAPWWKRLYGAVLAPRRPRTVQIG